LESKRGGGLNWDRDQDSEVAQATFSKRERSFKNASKNSGKSKGNGEGGQGIKSFFLTGILLVESHGGGFWSRGSGIDEEGEREPPAQSRERKKKETAGRKVLPTEESGPHFCRRPGG